MVKPVVEHIVWDWNGTIFDDSRALIEATIEAFHMCGMPSLTILDYQREHTQPIPVFYERLARRTLSPEEQVRLDQYFQVAYQRHQDKITLTHDSVEALSAWRAANRRQSLLSMYPHERLLPLVEKSGISGFFTRIDGAVRILRRKAPYLAEHLDRQGIKAEATVVIGDSVDDARAAQECGAHCLLYHRGDVALHARDHFLGFGVPIVETLVDAVRLLLDPSEVTA